MPLTDVQRQMDGIEEPTVLALGRWQDVSANMAGLRVVVCPTEASSLQALLAESIQSVVVDLDGFDLNAAVNFIGVARATRPDIGIVAVIQAASGSEKTLLAAVRSGLDGLVFREATDFPERLVATIADSAARDLQGAASESVDPSNRSGRLRRGDVALAATPYCQVGRVVAPLLAAGARTTVQDSGASNPVPPCHRGALVTCDLASCAPCLD
jgi:hypothetical protein